MRSKLSFLFGTLLAAIIAAASAPTASAAPHYKVLHAFGAGNDGATVWGGWFGIQRGTYTAQPPEEEPTPTVPCLS